MRNAPKRCVKDSECGNDVEDDPNEMCCGEIEIGKEGTKEKACFYRTLDTVKHQLGGKRFAVEDESGEELTTTIISFLCNSMTIAASTVTVLAIASYM